MSHLMIDEELICQSSNLNHRAQNSRGASRNSSHNDDQIVHPSLKMVNISSRKARPCTYAAQVKEGDIFFPQKKKKKIVSTSTTNNLQTSIHVSSIIMHGHYLRLSEFNSSPFPRTSNSKEND